MTVRKAFPSVRAYINNGLSFHVSEKLCASLSSHGKLRQKASKFSSLLALSRTFFFFFLSLLISGVEVLVNYVLSVTYFLSKVHKLSLTSSSGPPLLRVKHSLSFCLPRLLLHPTFSHLVLPRPINNTL